MAVISAFIRDAESLSLIIISCLQLPPPPVSRHLNRRIAHVKNGCILVISVSVFPFSPESSPSYIRMVVVPTWRCHTLYLC